MYLELAHRMYGEEAPKEIVFLYENKADQATKEFTVKADYEMVERIFFRAQKLMKAVNEKKMPECNVNPDGCKSCNSVVDLEGWGA
jgi:CRISPR/Cas system-associated exonuclease Cas4 (RecB family)